MKKINTPAGERSKGKEQKTQGKGHRITTSHGGKQKERKNK